MTDSEPRLWQPGDPVWQPRRWPRRLLGVVVLMAVAAAAFTVYRVFIYEPGTPSEAKCADRWNSELDIIDMAQSELRDLRNAINEQRYRDAANNWNNYLDVLAQEKYLETMDLCEPYFTNPEALRGDYLARRYTFTIREQECRELLRAHGANCR